MILLATGGSVLLSKIAGEGNFAETAARIRASEHLYRAALSSVLVMTISSALLAFSLYVTLAPVNRRLAQLGLIFCLGDSFLALLVRMCGFVRVHLYVAWRDPGVPAEPVSELLRAVAATTETLGGILFGIGSLLFFYLFYKSRYIPRWIAALGGIASGIWTTMYFAGLIFRKITQVFSSSASRRCSSPRW